MLYLINNEAPDMSKFQRDLSVDAESVAFVADGKNWPADAAGSSPRQQKTCLRDTILRDKMGSC